jgi:type VI protein secretion system component Hcp
MNQQDINEIQADRLTDLPVTDEHARQTAGGSDRPTESLSINFTKISYKYTPYDE